MFKYLKIYARLIQLNFTYMIMYRANFFNNLFSSVVWGIFNIAVIYLLTARSVTIPGWTRDELLLLAGGYTVLASVFQLFFAKNFEAFHEIIDTGKLDNVLLKPVNSQFLMTMKTIRYAQLIRLALGLGFMAYLLFVRLQYTPSALQFAGFFFVLFLSTLIVYSIWLLVSTIMIWNPRLSNVIELLYNVNSLARYPQDIFRELTFFLFFVVFPMTLVVNTPVKLLVGRDYIEDLLWMIILVFLLLHLAGRFWRYSLKHYTSASS